MKKSLTLFSISLILVSYSFLSAQSPGWAPWCPWNNYTSRLNLTSGQKVKFENLQLNFIKEIIPIQNHLTSKSLELRTLLFKSTPDNTAIIIKQKEISVLQQKFQEKILDYRLEALGILTTEQIVLLPSDCCLGINLGRGYGTGFGRGYGRGFGRAGGRGRGMGFYNGHGRGRGMRNNTKYCPYWQR